MRISFFLLLALFSFSTQAQTSTSVIPIPRQAKWEKGEFLFSACTRLQYDHANTRLGVALAPLVNKIKSASSIDLLSPKTCEKKTIVKVEIDASMAHEEGYVLSISSRQIQISARQPAGVFYAVQTLLQLLPESIESATPIKNAKWTVPCGFIADEPRFAYRGIMLDAARHFAPIDSVKRLIDLLAMQKMNRFHWHLTDGEGWRFESKKYPKLNTIGAYRKGDLFKNDFTYDYASRLNEAKYGGYYTQQQMKEVVQYAADRFITIVPEIEMPAHANAALAAYPELACLDSTGQPFPYPSQVQGEYCTKDETFTFLTEILSEVMTIFPSQYLHIGGDEAEKANWRTCRHCQQRMKEQGLKNVDELQSYFIRRIEQFVNRQGRHIIGWDEIMQGGLAPNAAVMSWTGTKNGIEAAKSGHYAVMTPISHCYLDHHQSDEPGEPLAYGGLTTLPDVYGYEPIAPELTPEQAKYILGVQGNLWTSYVPSVAQSEYMIFPRAIALAEIGWSSPERKDYADFVRRLLQYEKRLDHYQVNYSRHLFNVRISQLQPLNGKYYVTLSGSANGFPIHYTTDGSTPTAQSPVYQQPILLTGSTIVSAAILVNGQARDHLKKSFVFHKGLGAKGSLRIPADQQPTGPNAWHNGSFCHEKRINDYRFLDEERYNDDKWMGWNNKKFDGTLDFGQPERIQRISLRFFHNIPFGIMIPRSVQVQTSADGVNFTSVASQTPQLPNVDGAMPVSFSLPGITSRFVRIVAEPYGKTPAGNMAWLYVDEVVIE